MPATLEHGEFLNIREHGVFITGPAGIGKSTVALELLDRGHRLIADDVVFFQLKHGLVFGHCPDLLKNYLALRDLGVLNVTRLYGHAATQPSFRLDLVIRLVQEYHPRPPSMQVVQAEHNLLGIPFPEIEIIATQHRNLALVIETAVKNHILYKQGNDANQQLITKQQHII
jgi:HPr kinase/phosphorylase